MWCRERRRGGLETDEIHKMSAYTVFTVGTEAYYDRGIAEHGAKFKKVGRRENYAGGFALRTPEDAERLIDEQGKRGVWAVYALEADWDTDTVPSSNGWWHALIKSSRIVCKVPTSKEDAGTRKNS